MLSSYYKNVYGGFTVANDQITEVTGALIYDGATQTMSFDTSKLARATIHFSDIDEDVNSILFHISGINNAISRTQTFYLPDGDFLIGFRGAGSEFGWMRIANQTITLERYLTFDANHDIRFDLNALARVNITRGDELQMLSAIHEVGGYGGIDKGSYIIYLTPGTYAVIPRGNYDPFGTIVVDENSNVSSTGLLITDPTTNTIAYDIEHAPKLTFKWSQLSDTGTNKKIYFAGVFENIGSANDTSALFPLNSDFFVHGPSAISNRLGDFTIDATGNVTATGHMQVESAVPDANNRIHTTIGFKLCEMNSVTITPAIDLRYWFHPHFNTYLPSTVYLPNGEYKLYGDNGAKVTFNVDTDGIVVTEDNQNHVSLTYNLSSCVPPDADEDKVIDSLDICSDTPFGAVVDGDGCSVPQSIEIECAAWKARSHGKYVSCVTRVVNRAAEDGLISNDEKGALINDAAKDK